jgi:ParB-like chromosome segregation protein Spo0J
LTSCSSSSKEKDDQQLLIKINPEYSSLVHPLSDLEYEALKNSIKEDGLHYPIIINSKGEILDGHNRYTICKELEIPIKYEIKYFKDSIEEKKFVIDINLKRRHLSKFQRIQLSFKLAEIESEKARLRQLSKLKDVKDTLPLAQNYANGYNNEETGKVSKIVAKETGYSSRTCEMAKKIMQKGTEDQIKRLNEVRTTISKEYKKIQRDRKRQELLSQLNNMQSDKKNFENSNYKIIYGDFIEQSQKEIPDSSIDLIFTDPPYGKEYLPLYEELAQLAIRVLKPGGSLVFLVGHIILDDVFTIFREVSLKNNNSNLKYWWTLAVKHSGHHTKIHPRYVFAEWKPMVWYIKGDRINDLVISNTIGDYIESVAPLKIEHE